MREKRGRDRGRRSDAIGFGSFGLVGFGVSVFGERGEKREDGERVVDSLMGKIWVVSQLLLFCLRVLGYGTLGTANEVSFDAVNVMISVDHNSALGDRAAGIRYSALR